MEASAKGFPVVVLPHGLASRGHLGRAGEDAIERRILVHADFNDGVELDPPFRRSMSALCLADRARKAVKDKTGFSVRRVNPVRDDAQRHMVRDSAPAP